MLQVNWEAGRSDYIDNFVPFVLDCLRTMRPEVALPELHSTMLERFGLNLPRAALKTILQRCVRAGYLRKDHGIYYIERTKVDAQPGHGAVRAESERRQAALVATLRTYCQQEHDTSWTDEEANIALLDFVRLEVVSLLALVVSQQPIPPAAQAVPHSHFLISSFVAHLHKQDHDGFVSLCGLVKGSMLANALLYPDLGAVQRRFVQTDVYFDTKVVLQVLGLEGEEQAKPLQELLFLLREQGAQLRCFQKTIEEVRGALHGLSEDLTYSQRRERRSSAMLEYFLAQGRGAADVELIAARLEEYLQELSIIPIEAPTHALQLGLDEGRLTDALQKRVGYVSERARQHDLDALTAIYRLRRGTFPAHLEDSRALFVTSNEALVEASSRYFRDEFDRKDAFPCCVTDHLLTTLVWLKQPQRAPTLPENRLIADAYAALNPSEELWKRYLDRIATGQIDGQINAENYVLLRYATSAKRELMNLTLGDSDAFVDGTIEQVLARARAEVQAEALDELERQQQARAQAEEQARLAQRSADDQVAQVRAAEQATLKSTHEQHAHQVTHLNEQLRMAHEKQQTRYKDLHERLKRKAQRQARTARLAIYILCAAPLALTIWRISPVPAPPEWLHVPGPIAFFSGVLLTAITIGSVLEGTSLHSFLGPVEAKVAAWRERQLITDLLGKDDHELPESAHTETNNSHSDSADEVHLVVT